MSYIHPSRLINLSNHKQIIEKFAQSIKDSIINYCNNTQDSKSELVAYLNESNEVVISFPTLESEYVSERKVFISTSGSTYQVMNFFQYDVHKLALQIYLNGKVDITVTNKNISHARDGLSSLPESFDYNDDYLAPVIIENLFSYHIL